MLVHKRRVRTYRPGVQVALRTETGYRPAIVVQDNGEAEPMVKVRCTVNGVAQERWVYRIDLIAPPWVGPACSWCSVASPSASGPVSGRSPVRSNSNG
jgi:hypothetical protein